MPEPIDSDAFPELFYTENNPGYTTSMVAGGSNPSFSYDEALTRPQTVTQTPPSPDLPDGVYNYRYDAWGRLLERETPEGVTTYTYDELPPEEEEDASSAGWSTHFDADSRTVTWVSPDGTETTYQFDEADLEALDEEGSHASCQLPL